MNPCCCNIDCPTSCLDLSFSGIDYAPEYIESMLSLSTQHGQRLPYVNTFFGLHDALWINDPVWRFNNSGHPYYYPPNIVSGCAWRWVSAFCPLINYYIQTAKPTDANWRLRVGIELKNRIFYPDTIALATVAPADAVINFYGGRSDITAAVPKDAFFVFDADLGSEDFDIAHEFLTKRRGINVNYLEEYRARTTRWVKVVDIDEHAAVYPRFEDSTAHIKIKNSNSCQPIDLPNADNYDKELIALRVQLDDVRYDPKVLGAAGYDGWTVSAITLQNETEHGNQYKVSLTDGVATKDFYFFGDAVNVELGQAVNEGDVLGYRLYPEWYIAVLSAAGSGLCREYFYTANDGRNEGVCRFTPLWILAQQAYVKKLYTAIPGFAEEVIEATGWHVTIAPMWWGSYSGTWWPTSRGFTESTDCKPDNLEIAHYWSDGSPNIEAIDGKWLGVTSAAAFFDCRKSYRDTNYTGGRVFITGVELQDCALATAELTETLYLEAVSGTFNTSYSEVDYGSLYLEGTGHHTNTTSATFDDLSAGTAGAFRLRLHTDEPGINGTDNVYSGGGYADQTITWSTADGDGWRYLSNPTGFKGVATETITHATVWRYVSWVWTCLGSAAIVGGTFDSAGLLVFTKDTKIRYEVV